MLNQINLWQAMIVGWVRGHLVKDDTGASLVEYALLVALIALVAVTGVKQVASAVNTVFSSISTTLA